MRDSSAIAKVGIRLKEWISVGRPRVAPQSDREGARSSQSRQLGTGTSGEAGGRWRAVYESSAVGIVLTDITGRILAANPAFQRILGYSEGDLLGTLLIDITSEIDRPASRANTARLLDGTQPTYHALKRLRRKGQSIALEAANPAYETRIFGPDQIQVQGKLVGLIRRYH